MSEPTNALPEINMDKSSKAMGPPPIAEDAVFGEITEEGPNYRDVGEPLTTFTSLTDRK